MFGLGLANIDDAIQDTYLKLQRIIREGSSIPSTPDPDSARAVSDDGKALTKYLAVTIKNRLIDIRRATKRRRESG
jgi:DNA-directed RNA polymerase specialized sigma24 family protein